ncbi:MAG: type I-C CRISPR-associated endonuclease Cas1c [Paludibacteraceae bacterium]|nr:type I-C CRISPR-associated endonuclease Cas1c [Paludibacteraceae bacterium]
MRKLLNTLYVTTPESYLSKDGENVVVSINQKEVFRIPALNIEAIVTFGYIGASPGLMKLCTDNGIGLTFLSPNGKFISRVQGQVRGNVLLRKQQYKLADDESSIELAKICIAGKIQNYRSILRRYERDYGQVEEIENAVAEMDKAKRNVLQASTKEQIRGLEGDAASCYFSVFPNLIINQREDFSFCGRNRRPPKDAVNAMLSLAYTLLTNDVTSALESVGLDPYVGFLHALRPGRVSLALDMVEELRAYLGDRFVLSLINRKQITASDFLYQGEKGVVLTENGRKIFLSAWQTRKKETITHPFLQEKIPVGLIPYAQAMLMARCIRGDLDSYPVFIVK